MNELERIAMHKHPYYCSETNYFSNDHCAKWENATEFLDCMENSDIDMNLVFRWDIERNTDIETGEELEGYHARVFIIQQRKGIFYPHYIKSITEDELERFLKYIEKHWKRMNEMWAPISNK